MMDEERLATIQYKNKLIYAKEVAIHYVAHSFDTCLIKGSHLHYHLIDPIAITVTRYTNEA